MKFNQQINDFKAKYTEAGEVLHFNLWPVLFTELIQSGLNITDLDGRFYRELSRELFADQTDEVQVDAMDAMLLLGQFVTAPKKEAVPPPAVKTTQPTMPQKVSMDLLYTEHLTDNIPHEDDEGDPSYTPPSERLDLRPEDFAPKQYDEEFCARVGATKERR